MLVDANFVWRMVKAGWINRTITHILNTVRKWEDICSRSAVLIAVRNAMSANTGDKNWSEQKWKQHNPDDASKVDFGVLTCHALPDAEKEDIKISDLAHDVLKFPKGNDRGTLTEALELVRLDPRLDRNLADINGLIEEQGLPKIIYNAEKDRKCKDHWNKVAAGVLSRAYDVTNRNTVGGKRKD
jgi:hypothetical protein